MILLEVVRSRPVPVQFINYFIHSLNSKSHSLPIQLPLYTVIVPSFCIRHASVLKSILIQSVEPVYIFHVQIVEIKLFIKAVGFKPGLYNSLFVVVIIL